MILDRIGFNTTLRSVEVNPINKVENIVPITLIVPIPKVAMTEDFSIMCITVGTNDDTINTAIHLISTSRMYLLMLRLIPLHTNHTRNVCNTIAIIR